MMELAFAKEKLKEIREGVCVNGHAYTYQDWLIDQGYDTDQILLRLGLLSEADMEQVPWRRRPKRRNAQSKK